MPGIIRYEVDWETDTALVIYDASRVTVADIVRVLSDAGYPPGGVEPK